MTTLSMKRVKKDFLNSCTVGNGNEFLVMNGNEFLGVCIRLRWILILYTDFTHFQNKHSSKHFFDHINATN